MEISSVLKKYLNDNKYKLQTNNEKKLHDFWVDVVADYMNDINDLFSDDIDTLINLLITSGFHIEKYMTDDEIHDWLYDIDFDSSVELHLDTITKIDESSGDYLCNLQNVKAIYLPNCTYIDVNYLMVGCKQLKFVTLPKCGHLDVWYVCADCPNLEKVYLLDRTLNSKDCSKVNP